MVTPVFDLKSHWDSIYATKALNGVSWYQDNPERSSSLIDHCGLEKTSFLIDVGSGATHLIAELLDAGYQAITALDISEAALQVAQTQLGERASQVEWITADVRNVTLRPYHYDLWHDRAVLHFLTRTEDRAAYIRTLRRAVKPGGQAVIATFASDGPEQCSDLDVMRYSPESLTELLGEGFSLLETLAETHITPWHSEQRFTWCRFRVTGADSTLEGGDNACGDLIMQIFGRMKTLEPSQVLEVVTTDPGAPIDLAAWCRQTGHALVYQAPAVMKDSPSQFYIQKKGS